ncbi:uDP-N-acetylmuramoyl-tripeptide--D-alanyl-D-alanine ligase [Sutterella sp. CAG:351]|nr:uDP-N-acetylmuramoyl-tripeptide--D-alanyl-D-alanine ligase [Sutterella sp. CAG:351]
MKFDAVIQGLQAFKPVARRGVRHQLRPELLLIDDTYNANPDSMRAGIDVLTSSRGPLVLIAGDMGEVGTRGAEFHQEIGLYAKEKGVGTLLACGDLMQNACSAFGSGARHYADLDTLCREAAETVRGMEAGTVLVKASNFMHFDRVVKAVLEALSDAAVSE